jgi:transcription elongation GreA/GreB family factor
MNVISRRKEIEIGSVIKVKINSRSYRWQIVPEVDESSADHLIAGDSALGRALLGRGECDLIFHTLFDGTRIEIKILQIGGY